MNVELVVVQLFGDYAKGAVITDAKEIAAVLESHPHCVVKVCGGAVSGPAPAPVKGKN